MKKNKNINNSRSIKKSTVIYGEADGAHLQSRITLERQLEATKNQLDAVNLKLEDQLKEGWSYRGAWLEAHLLWQSEARKSLASPATSKNICNFAISPLKQLTFRTRDTASATIVGFAQLPSRIVADSILDQDLDSFDRVSLKISFEPPPRVGDATEGDLDIRLDPYLDNSLQVEREIIRSMFSRMLDQRNSPNVVAPIVDWYCPGSAISSELVADSDPTSRVQLLYQSLKISLAKDKKIKVDFHGPTHTLVIEKATATLNQLLTSLRKTKVEDSQEYGPPVLVMSDSDFYGLLFQCYYTLACFYRLGIRHNDLHLGNILYRKLSAPEDLLYKVEPGITVHIRTCYIIKFFDMDRGSVYYPGVSRNSALDAEYCDFAGECSGLYSNIDVSGFNLCLLDNLCTDNHTDDDKKRFNNIVSNIFDVETYQRFGWSNRKKDEYPQLWLDSAQKLAIDNSVLAEDGIKGVAHSKIDSDKYVDMIRAIKSPEACIWELINQNLVTSSTKESIPELYLPFNLPKQAIVSLGNPRSQMLGSGQQQLYSLADKNTAVIEAQKMAIVPLVAFQAFLLDEPRYDVILNQSKWSHIVGIWKKEIADDHVLDADGIDSLKTTWSWPVTAHKLWEAIRAEVDGVCIQFPVIMIACATLTCPMYYGLSLEARKDLRNMLASVAKTMLRPLIVSSDPDVAILDAESLLWKLFNQVLPLKIPLLYDLSN